MKQAFIRIRLVSFFVFSTFSILSAFSIFAAEEHVIWDRTPISFIVPAGKERMLIFSESVDFRNTDPALTTDKVSILNNNGTLYIKAKKTFDPIRVPIELKKTGEVVLVDISAQKNTDDTPVVVELKDAHNTLMGRKSSTAGVSSAIITYTDLIRYAVQHLYSPQRLVYDNPDINRTPMYTDKSVNLVYGGDVMAMPLESWSGGDFYVTAVLLKSITQSRVFINTNQLRGQWLAASFYPANYVTGIDTLHDRTTLFLISDRPFNEALSSMRETRGNVI